MESKLEALAPRPASSAEPPFQALVEAAGGRGQVLLVGELWEREQSRALLRDFARAVFPPEPAPGKPGCTEAESAGTAAATEPHRAPGDPGGGLQGPASCGTRSTSRRCLGKTGTAWPTDLLFLGSSEAEEEPRCHLLSKPSSRAPPGLRRGAGTDTCISQRGL